MRNGYPGYVAGDVRAGPRLERRASGVVVRGVRIGRHRTRAARAQILAGFCDVALVIGADTTPKGFLAPNKGERGDDPDWLRFRLLGATNPTFFGLYARRRMELFGATRDDFARVKVKNARHGLENPNARYKKEVSVDDVLNAPIVSDPLGLLDICATSDGAAALVVSSLDYARRHGAGDPVRVRGSRRSRRATRRPRSSSRTSRPTARRAPGALPSTGSRSRSPCAPTTRPASAPTTSIAPRSTTCRLRWSSTGTADPLARQASFRDGTTTLGGRVPVNPSGGLACFGEAVPAQAIAQVCELTWQVQGRAEGRQVEGASACRSTRASSATAPRSS